MTAMNDRIEQIEARAKDLTDLCPDYLRRGIRHLRRNCDMECPVHDEEAKWYGCNQPDRYDGGRMAEALSDIPTLLALVREQAAKLEAIEGLCSDWDAVVDVFPLTPAALFAGSHAKRIRAALTATEGAE